MIRAIKIISLILGIFIIYGIIKKSSERSNNDQLKKYYSYLEQSNGEVQIDSALRIYSKIIEIEGRSPTIFNEIGMLSSVLKSKNPLDGNSFLWNFTWKKSLIKK